MKPIIRKTLTPACALALLGNFNLAFADVTSDTELLLNWAEQTYPETFTVHKTTSTDGPWLYRNYSEVGIVAGVNKDDQNVYVMGGAFGSTPTLIGALATLMVTVNIESNTEKLFNWAEATYPTLFTTHSTTISEPPFLRRSYAGTGIVVSVNTDNNNVYITGGAYGNGQTLLGPITALLDLVNGNNSNTVCDAAVLPDGLTLTQNGNVITVSTNGDCIVPPTNQNYCQFDTTNPTATGIHMLTTGEVKNMELKGVLISVPGVFDQLLQSGLDFKTCVINAPSESANLVINTNVCYDITDYFKDVQSTPGVITITPPVQQSLEATAETEVVADCFATDALSVSDLVTGEVWLKTNGAWVKQPTP